MLDRGARSPDLAVEPPEWRAPVPGDESGCTQTRPFVSSALNEQQADKRLQAGDEHVLLFELIALVESIDLPESHGLLQIRDRDDPK